MQGQRVPTPKERDAHFQKCLKDAVELGLYPKKSQMFAHKFLNDLFAIADSYPETKPELVKRAKDNWAAHMRWLTS